MLREFSRARRSSGQTPACFRYMHLDHILLHGRVEVVGAELQRPRLSLVASDHCRVADTIDKPAKRSEEVNARAVPLILASGDI